MKKLLSVLLSFTSLFTFTTAELPEDYSYAADALSSEVATIPADGEYEVMPLSYAMSGDLKKFDQGDGNILFPYDSSGLSSSELNILSQFNNLYNPIDYDYIVQFSSNNSTSSFYFYFYEKSSERKVENITTEHSTGKCTNCYWLKSSKFYFFQFRYNSSSKCFDIEYIKRNSGVNTMLYCASGLMSNQSSKRFFFSNPEDASVSSAITARLYDVSSISFYDKNAPEPTTHTLTINYLYSEDNPAADPVVQELSSGEEYSIPSPEIEGYTPSIPLVTGTMPDEDLTIDVYYTKAFYPLTVKYQYQNGSQAAEPVTFQYPMGFSYDIPSPQIEGYNPDKPRVSGTMPGRALEEVVTYSPIPYNLSIFYQYEDGTQAAETHQEQLTVGAAYFVTSPKITGYKPDSEMISGTMPAKDISFTVTYKLDSSGGDSGGGSSGGGDQEGDGDDDDDDDDDPGGGGTGSGGSWPGRDPFIPNQPPFSGYDPFDMSGGLPGWSGYDPFYDPFHIWGLPPYTDDPFAMPGRG